MLDRWSVSVVATGKGGFRKGQKDRQLIMNNYLGIGVDGQVALDFHKVRFCLECPVLSWKPHSVQVCRGCCGVLRGRCWLFPKSAVFAYGR